jgi:hypothetical protein
VRYFEAHLWTVTALSVLLMLAFNWYSARQRPTDDASKLPGERPE